MCDCWSIGYEHRFGKNRRLQQAFIYARTQEHDHLFVLPLSRPPNEPLADVSAFPLLQLRSPHGFQRRRRLERQGGSQDRLCFPPHQPQQPRRSLWLHRPSRRRGRLAQGFWPCPYPPSSRVSRLPSRPHCRQGSEGGQELGCSSRPQAPSRSAASRRFLLVSCGLFLIALRQTQLTTSLSYSMDGNRLKWQNWDMHIGYNVSFLARLGSALASPFLLSPPPLLDLISLVSPVSLYQSLTYPSHAHSTARASSSTPFSTSTRTSSATVPSCTALRSRRWSFRTQVSRLHPPLLRKRNLTFRPLPSALCSSRMASPSQVRVRCRRVRTRDDGQLSRPWL